MAKTATKEGIRWRSWGSEAFEEARRSGKLILLDSGASWCHWCHVMDHRTYEDGEVIALINERFIPVRIDRDRLPDVDARFQSSVPIITSQGGGWPLTVLVTPEGHTLYKTTYLPPRADEGIGASMGLIELLEVLERHWRENHQAIADAAERLSEGLLQEHRQIYCQAGKLADDLVDTIFAGLERAYDSQHGGFGDAPKFFNAPALELLETLAWRGNARARDMLAKTLQSIARGGVYDHVGGGFHRYSLDARWHVPHFEKMAADNAALLAIYANAYALTGLKDFQQVAIETRDWIDHVLGGSKREGFYASQDADAGAGDDGDYFTWTVEEFRAATGELADVAMDYYDIDAQGDMPDRPGRNVLHVVKPPDVQARLQNISPQELTARIGQARHYLRSARTKRRSPAVDRTAFADVNGMMIDAYLTCYERLDDAGAGEIAFATLDHLLAVLRDDRGVFAHYRQDGILENAGLLADQAWMARSLVHAFAASANREYLDAATILADYIIGELASEYGGFAAAPAPKDASPASVPPSVGWEDSAARSAASVAAWALADLGHLAGRQDFSAAAAKAMESFAGGVKHQWATFLAGYATAAEYLLHGPRVILIAGTVDDKVTSSLAQTARRQYVPGTLVMAMDSGNKEHRELLDRLGVAPVSQPAAYVCCGKSCLAPARDYQQLIQRLAGLSRL